MINQWELEAQRAADAASVGIRAQAQSKAGLLIQLEGVAKHYDTEAGTVPVLDDIDLQVAKSEIVVVKGVSGSGKSTLLHLLGAVDKPSRGLVRVCDRDIGGMSLRDQTSFRGRNIGFVFQFFNLIPTLTAKENVVAALEPAGGTRASRDAAATEALLAVGLQAHSDKYPSQLSGGQQQRVAIARAIAKRPAIVLADEPTGALDAATARQVLQLLDQLRREYGCAVVIATHDPLVSEYADRVLRLEGGRLLAEAAER